MISFCDGDLDAIVGTWSDQLRIYRNDATDGSLMLNFVDSTSIVLSRGRNATPTLGDIDNDGDLDLFVGESSGTINFYENTGTPQSAEFTLVSDEYGDFDIGRRSLPVLRDARQRDALGREVLRLREGHERPLCR